jgi:hypothetical protein
MSLPYAEQILLTAQRNQWFIQFNPDHAEFDLPSMLSQIAWMQNQGLTVTEVQTVHYTDSPTHFYHVNFENSQDSRLLEYCAVYEDSEGQSMSPQEYQMYEWSYAAWIADQGDQKFAEYLHAPPETTAIQGT